MKNIFVLDACALIAFFNNEPGADYICNLIREANNRRIIVKMNQVNLLEVYYNVIKVYNHNKANEMLKTVERSPIKVITKLSKNVFNAAGRIKSTYHIPMGDTIAAAECIIGNGTLVTSDHKDFEKVERSENIKVLWFR